MTTCEEAIYYWKSIILDGTIPQSDIERMITESYERTRSK